jgi:hypothetical protein
VTLPHSTNIFNYPARFQFGQASAPCGGSSCCTDTCIQQIVEFYKEKTYSLQTIRNAAQRLTSFNEGPCTGINYVEVLNALSYFGINHYRHGAGIDHADVGNWIGYGPIILGVHYGSYPNTTTGRCGANQAEVAGRSDCGFSGAHAVLVIGKKPHVVNSKVIHTDYYVRDPDHNSPARPEKPSYDRYSAAKLNTALMNLPKYTAFSSTYMVYPTRKKVI